MRAREKRISVAGCVGRVERELAELFGELLCIAFWNREEMTMITAKIKKAREVGVWDGWGVVGERGVVGVEKGNKIDQNEG